MKTFAGTLYYEGVVPQLGCPPASAFFTLILPSVGAGYDMSWTETSGAVTNTLVGAVDLSKPHPNVIIGPLQPWNGGPPSGPVLGIASAAVTETCGFVPNGGPGPGDFVTNDSGPMNLTFRAPTPHPVT